MRPSQKRQRQRRAAAQRENTVSRRKQTFVGVGCLLFGTFLAFAAVASLLDDRSLRHSGVSTAAVAVASDSASKTAFCKVRFTDAAGAIHTETIKGYPCGVSIGAAVDVIVNPHDASDVELPRGLGGASTAVDATLGALSLALAGFGIWILRIPTERYRLLKRR